jgi:uncharacterized membrane protein YtjA (UPF0391 family)
MRLSRYLGIGSSFERFIRFWHSNCVLFQTWPAYPNSRQDDDFPKGVFKSSRERRPNMLRWALTFLVIALIAAALGMFQVEAIAVQIAWILFVVFLILAVVSMVAGRSSGPPV